MEAEAKRLAAKMAEEKLGIIKGMGTNAYARVYVDDEQFYEIKNALGSTRSCDFEELAKNFPDAFAVCVRQKPHSAPTFSISKLKKERTSK